MSNIRQVTPDFFVASQLSPVDMAEAAALGIKLVINNRPEGESAEQASGTEMKAAAEAAGIAYQALPFVMPPPPGVVAATAQVIEDAPGPVLAYCRTGTRSVTAWAMAQALQGSLSPDELVALAGKAGYDLSGTRGALVQLAPGQ
ncbi:sulfide-quinone reductase [alpha proteobacterium U9-1i]|nr:sulfide-quinone reductase [alpha proteobacterium U9-1i]